MRVLVFVTAFLWLASAAAASPQLTVLGGEQQVEVTGAQPGARYVLTHDGRVVAFHRAGSLGGIVFRDVPSGTGYRVGLALNGPSSRAVTVLSGRPAPPSARIYSQRIPASGYGYLTRTRHSSNTRATVTPIRPAPRTGSRRSPTCSDSPWSM